MNLEHSLSDGVDDVMAQHEVSDVCRGNDHSLRPGQPADFADVEESLDLVVYTANRLDLATLIDRPGDGPGLIDWHVAYRGQEGV